MNKKFNKKKLAMFIVPILALMLISAIGYYVLFSSHFDVSPAFSITGDTAQELGNFYSNNEGIVIVGTPLTVTSNAQEEREATLIDDSGGNVDVNYYELVEYSFQTTVGNQPVDVNVEDLGDSIKWTVDFPMEAPYNPLVMNGHFAVGLVIATDGEGEGPAFQIHNNDGTDPTYDWGTWLMSPWGPTITDGWMGWHSGYDNTPVTDVSLDWVSATGDKYYENNPDGIYTITIDKSELGEDFHWALNLAIGSGFSSEYYYYEQTSVPIGNTPWFDWGTPLVDMSVPNYVYAELMEELENPFTVQAGGSVVLTPVYTVAPYVTGEYTITTKVI